MSDISGDVFNDTQIEKIMVQKAKSGIDISVLQKDSDIVYSLNWEEPNLNAKGELHPGLIEALMKEISSVEQDEEEY